MHYYTFNVGDYRKDTGHLSTLEHGIYRQLLDWYYLDEKPIPQETQVVLRRLRLGSDSDIAALQNVLADFFVLQADGYHQTRCDADIAVYHSKAEVNKINGKLGGRPKKTQVVSVGLPDETQNNLNQEPLTINQEPKVKTQRGSRLPTNWSLPEDWKAWAENERPDLLINKVADSFKDFWISKPGSGGNKLNWEATWRNWIRSQSAPKQAFANKYDVAHVTTPPPPNQDAALRKIEEDSKRAAKPNAEVQAKIAELLKGNRV
jgi:uncharacterized protein YdaU (DUF1376 family)